MVIASVEEYEEKEKRLDEIEKRLEAIAEKEEISVSEVISLRDEAKELAEAMRIFIKEMFEPKK